MGLNAAGLDVAGDKNPRWKGGLIQKCCEVCGKDYAVKNVHSGSRFCSLQCVGKARKGKPMAKRNRVFKECEICGAEYSVFGSHADRWHCCSKECSFKRRAAVMKGHGNPNWNGGLSRFPYPWNFREISRQIIERDGFKCMNPGCGGHDQRLTTHHINYDKQDCREENLIALCSACNSKANYGRDEWQRFYTELVGTRPAA